MSDLVDLLIDLLMLLVDNKIFNVPLLVWLILPAVIALVIKFIQGKK